VAVSGTCPGAGFRRCELIAVTRGGRTSGGGRRGSRPCAQFFDCAVGGKRQREVAAGMRVDDLAQIPGGASCLSIITDQPWRGEILDQIRQPGRRRGSRGCPWRCCRRSRWDSTEPGEAVCNRRARRAPAQTAQIPKRRDVALDAEEAIGRQTLRRQYRHIRVVLARRPPEPEVGPGPPGTWTASRGGR
jgi:hypothetical protein